MASGVVREDAIRMDAAKGGSGTYGKKIRKQKNHGEQTRELQTGGGMRTVKSLKNACI